MSPDHRIPLRIRDDSELQLRRPMRTTPRKRRRSSRVPLLLVGLAAGAVMVGALVARGDDEEDRDTSSGGGTYFGRAAGSRGEHSVSGRGTSRGGFGWFGGRSAGG